MKRFTAAALARVRKHCLALPETMERLSHGSPTFFVREKLPFVMFLDNHHGDGRLALWCAAPRGIQEMLVTGNPDAYFRPPYVGHLGWIGVRLDRGLGWDEIAGVIEDAYLARAPRSLTRSRKGANHEKGAIAAPAGPARYRVRQLLRRVTKNNIHDELD